MINILRDLMEKVDNIKKNRRLMKTGRNSEKQSNDAKNQTQK